MEESLLLNLPLEILRQIFNHAISTAYFWNIIPARRVNSKLKSHFLSASKANSHVSEIFAQDILVAFCNPDNLNFSNPDFFREGVQVSEPFVTGALLTRLDCSYAVNSHFLSTILEAEELLMLKAPGSRQQYRYALCATETWASCKSIQGVLPLMDPVFPENEYLITQTSPLEHALYAAAWMGNASLIRHLLAKGTNVNLQNGYFRPALQQAARKGHYDVVEQLLDADAYPVFGYWAVSYWSRNGALSLASRYGHARIVELFLRDTCRLAAMERIYTNDMWMWRSMLESAIVPAIVGGHREVLEMVMASPDVRGDLSMTEMHLEILNIAVGAGREEMVRWALDVEFDKPAWYREFQQHLLKTAARSGWDAIVRLLLERGAGPVDSDVLKSVAHNGHVHVARTLLDSLPQGTDVWAIVNGYCPGIPESQEDTPLCWAKMMGHDSMVEFLLEQAADCGVGDALRRIPTILYRMWGKSSDWSKIRIFTRKS